MRSSRATIGSRSRLPIRPTVRRSREACRSLCRSGKGAGLRAGVERGIMIRWIPAAAIAAFVLGAPVAYAQAPAKDARSSRSAFPAGSIEGRVLDDSNRPGRRRDGVGRWQNDGRGRNRSRRPILAARASVRSLHSQRALARLLQVARAHGSADDLKSFHPRDSAPDCARRESAGRPRPNPWPTRPPCR